MEEKGILVNGNKYPEEYKDGIRIGMIYLYNKFIADRLC